MNLLREIAERERREVVELGPVERRVTTPDLAGLETISLGLG